MNPFRKNEILPYTFLLWSLIITGFAVRLYMAHVDPFLHIWDERFHALVARNMMDAPFVPMLRSNPVLPDHPFSWTQSSLWLHKPPLFMWQMALSMKIFGPSVFAMRYPGVLMGTLMIPMVYRIVESVTKDKSIAIVTAALFCFSNFHLELVAGIRSMDQNDLTLEFYVLASVWAWVKYREKGKWHWLLLIGLFAGAAILTKWLIGLFIFLIWGLKILLQSRRSIDIREIGRMLFSLFICCVVFLPWQFYIIRNFPAESAFEYAFNRRHITEALEGHDGSVFFYLARFPQLFGEGIFLLIFPGLYLCHVSKNKDRDRSLPILLASLFVFLFFSVIVKTKVISHLYFIAPFAMMLMAYSIVFIKRKWLKKAWFYIPLFIGIGVLNTKPEKIILDQSASVEERNINLSNAEVYRNTAKKIAQHAVVVNVPDWVSFMFFNKGAVAYETFSEAEVASLKRRKIIITAFDNVRNRPLPDYIASYPYLHLLHEELK